jgi:hypothetical protein
VLIDEEVVEAAEVTDAEVEGVIEASGVEIEAREVGIEVNEVEVEAREAEVEAREVVIELEDPPPVNIAQSA